MFVDDETDPEDYPADNDAARKRYGDGKDGNADTGAQGYEESFGDDEDDGEGEVEADGAEVGLGLEKDILS